MHSKLSISKESKSRLLSLFFTAGYPRRDDTATLLSAISEAEVDFVEIGFPFSDPVADGEVIQRSSEAALVNGMSLSRLFEQLRQIKDQKTPPILLMGYINPVLQYGVEEFFRACKEVGVKALIIPDLPFEEYQRSWKALFKRFEMQPVFLITSRTSEERIRIFDREEPAFLYVVSSEATTGGASFAHEALDGFLDRLNSMQLTTPLIVGFGISDADGFSRATAKSSGGIIGSAFIRRLQSVPVGDSAHESDHDGLREAVHTFLSELPNRSSRSRT